MSIKDFEEEKISKTKQGLLDDERSTAAFLLAARGNQGDGHARKEVPARTQVPATIQTWRDLLAQIIQNEEVKLDLIDSLSISPVTLSRWITGKSDPRPQNLRHLINALPQQYREQMYALLRNENKLAHASAPGEDAPPLGEILPEFYTNILLARATMNANLRFWSLGHLIVQQALEQLDPERRGMSLWVARCMPPSGSQQKIRSLRESVGLGTAPWKNNLEQDAMFLGAESLVGSVVTSYRPGVVQDLLDEHNLLSLSHVEHERSIAIYPILYCGRIAGVFMASSAEVNYFLGQNRTNLVQYYADLLALAFNDEDFYSPDQISLEVMPPYEEQKVYFAGFRQLMTSIILESVSNNQPVDNTQADLIAWQRLENTLLGRFSPDEH